MAPGKSVPASKTKLDVIFGIPLDPPDGWFDIDLQDNWGETPLYIAVYRQLPELVRRLLERNARRDLQTHEGSHVALHYAANLSSSECQNALVRLLASDRGPHVNMRDENGCPLLFSLFGNLRAVQLLLKVGANQGILDRDGSSAIHHACAAGYAESLDLLLAHRSLLVALPLLRTAE